MATYFTPFDRTGGKPGGFRLGRLMEAGENFLNWAIAERASMLAMLGDNNGSQDAHFVEFVTVYGFADSADAHAFWQEFDTAFNKFAVDGNVSNVLSALRQLFGRCRS